MSPASSSGPFAAPSLSITVNPRAVAIVLSVLVLLLAIVGAAAHYVITNIAPQLDDSVGAKLAEALGVIGLQGEPALQHWYSSLALLACATAMLFIAWHHKRNRESCKGWFLLGLLVLFLSLDEGIEIHELFSAPARHWLGVGQALEWAWVVPYALLALIVGLLSLRFVLRLDPSTRNLFLVSGVMFCVGALGGDVVGSLLFSSRGIGSIAYLVFMTIEELLEMYAVVILLYALLRYIEKNIGQISLDVTARDREFQDKAP